MIKLQAPASPKINYFSSVYKLQVPWNTRIVLVPQG